MSNVEFNPSDVQVDVVTTYLQEHSKPAEDHYTFAYTITIRNHSSVPVQLLSRHWIITNADNEVHQVRGEGVVGEQPVVHPARSFTYTSGATLTTPVGCMEGSYSMVVRNPIDIDPKDLPTFEVPIPAFSLHKPNALN
ncbi:MAG: Co2+/Mg2+ efflux protein ApaG [Gammaproteobacteria bacterium]|jgi:ApaG protein|nr:Co2+/Mg2+ efflux protein ApaG [Gammaproteobacteria bacterium]